MDGIKLEGWRKSFEEKIKSFSAEYSSYSRAQPLESVYSIQLDESNEWHLTIAQGVPDAIKERLEQLFLDSKPEDSV